ncbi:hypothetical protein OZ411_37305 [Bradyrhizobium sp. Arg237L]|uniref:hypothetical protein n=1 Tax=Bradyrhizobium sp. Arg237L TaxID=3003352 RepID=UPI00249F24A3|nr:hypothetical protein [Bradyrhizobium sp. Arg237L]MDI4238466.1 hypothetical protein [Bradyrhizobium sp. Arg237L]
MHIKETIGVSFPGSVEGLPLEDVVVLVDSAGVALGVQRAFSAPSSNGGVFHVVNPSTATPTS